MGSHHNVFLSMQGQMIPIASKNIPSCRCSLPSRLVASRSAKSSHNGSCRVVWRNVNRAVCSFALIFGCISSGIEAMCIGAEEQLSADDDSLHRMLMKRLEKRSCSSRYKWQDPLALPRHSHVLSHRYFRSPPSRPTIELYTT